MKKSRFPEYDPQERIRRILARWIMFGIITLSASASLLIVLYSDKACFGAPMVLIFLCSIAFFVSFLDYNRENPL